MNYKNALKWLNEIPISFNKDYKGYKLTLKKVYDLFNYLKNPEKKLQYQVLQIIPNQRFQM